ncbi:uncharacterized protein LOC131951322 [Physella acuta]|uniref:uncharacterized protein LOC131951322 n=1 Tax=Physella acuta TaxID=109671 RepID=UPI0027DDBD9D|nr:uncharacterized protein LOC131951322 [Physella acuta]
MDIVNSMLTLLFIVICLGTVICDRSLGSMIGGFQKECEEPGCRYTGKIVGSVRFKEEYLKMLDDCVLLVVRSRNSGVKASKWNVLCMMVICPSDSCSRRQSACNCSGFNPVSVEFYPYQDSQYRIDIFATLKYSGPGQPIRNFTLIKDLSSNIFDATTKPDNWNPIFVHGPENIDLTAVEKKAGQFTNGNSPLTGGTNIVGITTLFAYLLRKIMFDE